MTYYIENRKSSEENEKQSFGRATFLRKKNGKRRIGMLKGEKDADETAHKRATRKIYRVSIFSVSNFLLAGGCKNFLVFIEFHSIYEPSWWDK